MQWKCIKKTVILKNYSSLLLTLVCCIFYNLKIVILTFFHVVYSALNYLLRLQVFTVFMNTTKKTVKIEKNAKIHLFVLYKFNLTTFSQQAWLAQW